MGRMKLLISGVAMAVQLCLRAEPEEASASSKVNEVFEMENDLLKISFEAGHGGIVRTLTFKNGGSQEVFFSEKGGIGGVCEDRLGGQPYPGEICMSPYKGEFLEKSREKTVLQFSYQSESGQNKGLRFIKVYTLEKGSAALRVDWRIENHSQGTQEIVPWVHNILNGYGNVKGDTLLVLDGRVTRRKACGVDFMVTPGAGWIAKVSPEEGPAGRPLFFITDYEQTFQYAM